MTTKLLVNTPFDIEIVLDGKPTGRYVNRARGDARDMDLNNYTYSNRDTEQRIYCVPGVSFKFDVDASIDRNVVLERTQQNDQGKLNFIYRVSKRNLTWDFGDGVQSQEYQPVHVYDKPGVYTITVKLYDELGNPTRNPYTYTLEILNFCADHVAWYTRNAELYGIDYTPASTPLSLELRKMTSWQHPELYSTVVMYASGSDSIPSTPETYKNNKYAHLQSLWRFVDNLDDPVPINTARIDGEPIRVRVNPDDLLIDQSESPDIPGPTGMNLIVDTSVYSSDDTTTRVIGFSGTKSVYYIDDTVKNYLSRDVNPVFLFASLSSTEALSDVNETPVDVLPVKVTYGPGVELQISTNGIKTFDLEDTMFVDSEYCVNVSIVNQYGLIIKTDYPKLSIDVTDDQYLKPYQTRLNVIDSDDESLVQLDIVPRDLPIETRGCGDYVVTPKQTAPAESTLRAELLISDPAYTPMDTPVYVLTDMHDPVAHFLTPGFAGFINAHGATYSTLSDNTLVSTISSAALNIIDREAELPYSCFATCVDPARGYVYVANETNDNIMQYSLMGQPLNDNQPINILELICRSGILDDDERFNYNDVTGSEILDVLAGSTEENAPARLENTDYTLCDRFNVNMTEINALSPSSLACDEHGNIWTTFIDGVLTVRLSHDDKRGHYISAIAIPEEVNFYNNPTISKLIEKTESGEYKWMPSRVVTDKNNDIWVSYTNQDNVRLIKYSSQVDQGSYQMKQLADIIFPSGTHLDDMIIDSSNNLWVSDARSLSERKISSEVDAIDMIGGGVYHISNDINPAIVKYITEYYDAATQASVKFDKPCDMTFDLMDNLYVVSGSNKIVKINPGTHEASVAFSAGTSWFDLANDHQRQLERSRGHTCAIDAMSCNSDNRLLIVNNIDKDLVAYICPDTWNGESEYSVEAVVYDSTDNPDWRLMQGSGDWTGIRWINTYMKTVQGQRTVSAERKVQIKTVEQDELMKINEDFDATETFNEYALQETINTRENLLMWFFNRVSGDSDSDGNTLGKTVYEKISNFVSNNTDVDTCNIKNLSSLAKQLGCDLKSYEYSYPGSLKRLIDMLSVKYCQLTPSRDKTGREFTKNGYANNFNHGRNIGPEPVDPETYRVRVGVPLIAKELYNSVYTYIEPMAIRGSSDDTNYSELHGGLVEYNLSMYDEIESSTTTPAGLMWNWGLSHPTNESVFLYYDFYEYVPDETHKSENFEQHEGVVDWNNPQTTVSESVSLDEWNRSGGVIDTLVNRAIRRGVNLL